MTLQQALSKKRQEALAKENVKPTTKEISLKETVTNIIEKNSTPIFRTLQAIEPTNKKLEIRITAFEDCWSIRHTVPYCEMLLLQHMYDYANHSIPYNKVWNEISIKAPAHSFIVENEKHEFSKPYGVLDYTIIMYLD